MESLMRAGMMRAGLMRGACRVWGEVVCGGAGAGGGGVAAWAKKGSGGAGAWLSTSSVMQQKTGAALGRTMWSGIYQARGYFSEELKFVTRGAKQRLQFSSSSSGGTAITSKIVSEALHGSSSSSSIISQTLSSPGAAKSLAKSHLLVAGGDAAARQVALWLATCTGFVFSMVVLGGVTRLTRSGLSMTEWKFFGTLPPLNDHEWQVEFGKYKQSPEFRKCNSRMTLDEFKFIYFMEYAHRMWGRGLGVVFGLPVLYFGFKGYITRKLAVPLSLLFLAGGCQGFIGWWMVKSGLNEPLYHYDIPRVSPYRLATHLTSAFAIYTGLLWTTLSVAFPKSPAALATSSAVREGAAKVRRLALPLTALIGITAVSGAFVAGLDAGHAYNTFPLMNGQLIPEEVLRLRPIWKNFFENTATVQFDHRVLAISTLGSVSAVWYLTRGMPMPSRTTLLLNALLGVTCMQVSLGIATLLNYVPVSLGSAHQAGALTLFSVAISLLHSLRK